MSASGSMKLICPDDWPQAKGLSYGAIAEGRAILCVSGQLGGETGALPPGPGVPLANQFVKCLDNVVKVVRAAGGAPEDIATLRVFVTDIRAFKDQQPNITSGWRRLLGRHFPAMTMVEVRALYEEAALVEIEAIALVEKVEQNEI